MKKLAVALSAVGLLALGACSHSKTDYKDAAEKALKNDGTDATGGDLKDIKCDTPSSKDVGTTFQCTATGTDGLTYTYTATIESSKSVIVRPDTSSTPDETTTTTG